ncbi:MAG: hypothetical protein CSA64_05200 [Arachnia propionica]|nr:MAG: hypothetical protein CSA64_05200 [Arachnia propionica]
MALYSKGKRGLWQAVADVSVVAWGVVWAVLGRFSFNLIQTLKQPAEATRNAALDMAERFNSAANQVSQVPGVGPTVRRPFDSATSGLESIVRSMQEQADLINTISIVVGWSVFVIPFALVVVFWLPARIRFWRESTAAQALLEHADATELFSLRALSSQPIRTLVKISPTPVSDWIAGDSEVIDQLAALELRRLGVSTGPKKLTAADNLAEPESE